MAEMTAAQAIAWLTSDKAFGQECYSRKQIAQLIEQQAQEIAKKDKVIEKIYAPLKNCDCKGEKAKCDVLDAGIYPWDLCEYYWLCEIAWLEKEAEEVE